MSLLILGLILFLGVHSLRIFADPWRTAQIARLGLVAEPVDDDIRRCAAYGGNRTTGKTSIHAIDRAYADGVAALVRNIGVAARDS